MLILFELISMEHSLVEKLAVAQLAKKLHAIYGTLMFITVFMRVLCVILPELEESILHRR
jgi:hypothetical protein